MATYRTNQTLGRGPAPGVGGSRMEVTAYAEYAITAALATNDKIEMLRVPPGAIITGCTLTVPDLDTDGSPAILLTVGDGSDTDRLIASTNIGQAGGTTSSLASAGQFYEYTAEDTIDILVATGAATGATTGTLKLMVKFLVNPAKS